MNFFKKIAKKSIKANKYLFGGKAVKDAIKVGGSAVSKVAKQNPELAQAAFTAAGASTGFGDLAGLLGGFGGFGSSPYEAEPSAPEPPPAPGLVPGFDTKTLLIAGGALAVVVVLASRK